MKLIIALCLVSVSLAAPQLREEYREPIKIIRSEIDPIEGPNFRYAYETENGIEVEKIGSEGSKGQSNMNGFFRFPLPDGTIAEFTYVADEAGYHVESPSNHLPVAPPMPAHALAQIQFAADERKNGTDWDQQGFKIKV